MAQVKQDYSDFEVQSQRNEPCFGSLLGCLGRFFGCFCTSICCGCCCYPYKTIPLGSKGVIQRFGRLKNIVDDGLYYVNPVTETMASVDMRTQCLLLSSQTVMTKDNLSLKIDGDVYYKITSVSKSLFSISKVEKAIYERSHAALRNVFGKHELQQCLENREQIAMEIQKDIGIQVENWGIMIETIQIKDIIVPEQIEKLLASAATAEREGRAKIISAQADVEAAKLMRAASDILNTPAAMQIRYLETMYKMSDNDNSKVIFMPSDYRQVANTLSLNELNK